MKIMGTSFKRSHACTAYTQFPQPCNRPPPTHASTQDSCKLPGKPRSVSCGVTAPFSWLLASQVSVCALQKSISQSCVSSGSSMVGLMTTSSKRASATPRSAAPRAPAPRQAMLTRTSAGTLRHSLSQSPWGLWVLVRTRFVGALWVSLAGWGLILNVISPLLLSSGASPLPLVVGNVLKVTPALRSACHLAGVSLPLDMGYIFEGAQTPHNRRFRQSS